MRTTSARAAATALLGTAVACTAACGALDWDKSGFEQLGGKAPRAIDLPGVDLGEVGNFTPTQALGRNGSLQAVAGVTDDGKVRIVHSTEASACTATTLPEGANPASYVPAALEDMLVVLDDRDGQGRGTLHVYDTSCDEVSRPLPTARAVPGSERLVPSRLLLESDGDLLSLRAEDRELDTVERAVSFVSITSSHVISSAGGELVVRDLALKEHARHGDDVSEVVLVAGGSKIAFVDGGKLRWLADLRSQPTTLDADVCAVNVADGPTRPGQGGSRYLSYFSPCSESQLVVYDYVEQRRIDIAPALESRAVVHTLDQQSLVFYSAPSLDDPTTAAVWVRLGDAEPALVGPGTLGGVGLLTGDSVSVWPEPTEGPLLRWSKQGVSPWLDSVVAFEASSYPERALLADGHLLQLEGFEQPRQIASGATSPGRGSATASLFFAKVEDNLGSLRLLRSESGEIEPVGDRVRVPSASFWFTGQALFYHQEYQPSTGRGELCMRLVDNGDTYCEADVVDWRVMIRPERGVALTRRVGAGVHLFWAEVD